MNEKPISTDLDAAVESDRRWEAPAIVIVPIGDTQAGPGTSPDANFFDFMFS